MIKTDYENYIYDFQAKQGIRPQHFVPISVELSEYIISICEKYKPKRILDAGSGWSSILFKKYYPLGHTITVDTEEQWLNITKEYFKKFELDLNEMWLWEEFLTTNPEPFDLILHDLGFVIDIREKTLPKMFEMVADGGIIVIDNTHEPFGRDIPLMAKSMGFKILGDYKYFMALQKKGDKK